MTTPNLRKPPRGVQAWFWRAPIFFYRAGLGWMLGGRFLLLNHIGRKSRLPRKAVLEIIKHDAKTYYSASGFGEKSHWYQNIMHSPDVKIQVGRKKMNTHAERLSHAEAKDVLGEYAEKHPRALRELMLVVGLSYDGSEDSLENLVNLLPIIAFHIQQKE